SVIARRRWPEPCSRRWSRTYRSDRNRPALERAGQGGGRVHPAANPAGTARRPGPDGPGLRRLRNASALEGVLHVLAGVLEVALGVVLVALGLQVTVAGGAADPLLDLAAQLFGGVLDLVGEAHQILCDVGLGLVRGHLRR